MAKETNIHRGHRASMRRKYLSLGPSAFYTHELLEILLYYAVPVCDTNPTAHRLLDSFGQLSAVFDAEEKALLSVSGIGERTVRLLRLVRAIGRRFRYLSQSLAAENSVCISLEDLVLSLTDASESDADVTRLILLDGAGRLISVERVFEGTVLSPDFEIRSLVEPAIRRRAVLAVICTYPRSRSIRPGAYDGTLTAGIRDAFARIGVRLVEHFIVSGEYAARLSRHFPECLDGAAELTEVFGIASRPDASDTEPLSELFSFAGYQLAERALSEMILSLGGVDRFMSAAVPDLVRLGIPEKAAILLSLSIALYVRASVDEAVTASPLDRAERIGEYLVRYYLGVTSERAVLLLLDRSDRLMRTEILSEGVVDGASVELRRVLELALLHGAASVVLAHNHPSGSPLPSPEDEEVTRLLVDALDSVGIPLTEHFIVTSDSYTPIRLASRRLAICRPASFYGDALIARIGALLK